MRARIASHRGKNVASPEWKYMKLESIVRNGWNFWAVYNRLPRLLTPHLLGSRNGELRVFSYQYGGKTKSGLHPPGSPNNFRCMRVRDLQDIAVLDDRWYTGDGSGNRQTCLDRIDARHPRMVEEDKAA